MNKSRQVGISYIIACHALIKAIGDKKTELIISPSLRQSKHMMDYIYSFHNKIKNKIRDYEKNVVEETKTSIIFKDGGEIHSLPNSANTVRGFKADDIYIDEFAHFINGTDKEIVEAIMPSISRGGTIRYISTPFGDQNTFYELWQRPDTPKLLINYKECPDLETEDIQRIRSTLGEDAFQQEYNNQFLSDMEGQEFPTELIKRCIDNELEYQDLQKNKNYLGGADIGREHDLTAFVALEKQDDVFILRNKHVMRQTPYKEQMDYFNNILINYNFQSFLIDESGIGNMMAEELARNHLITRLTFNNENKQELVGNLKKTMQEGRLRIVDDPLLINSIRSIRRIYTPSNYLRFDSERDGELGHADLFWALALALYEQTQETYFRIG